MENIQIHNTYNLLEDIKNMKINTYYNMPDDFRYRWIKIDQERDYYTNEIYYSWSMEHNYNVTKAVGYAFPLTAGGNTVKQFKTEAGAKRNLINRFKKYLSEGLN